MNEPSPSTPVRGNSEQALPQAVLAQEFSAEDAEAGTQSASADTAALPAPALPAPTTPVPSKVEGRHDGWTGERMAIFCETLAETAVVAEACDVARMSISGAYAHRRRNPVFAAAWDAALTIARERLADTLLARSMEGNIEQIWRDGELVGERHVIDNRLGLAILKRLDRLSAGEMPGACQTAKSKPGIRTQPFDWPLAVDALRTGDEAAVCKALALFKEPALSLSKGDEVEEVEDYPFFSGGGDTEPEELDLSDRCWRDQDGAWMTDFPPPAGFTAYQSCEWGEPEKIYERECTAEEIAILDAEIAAARAAERAEEESLRDSWFALLRAECSAHEHGQHGVLTEHSADADQEVDARARKAHPLPGVGGE